MAAWLVLRGALCEDMREFECGVWDVGVWWVCVGWVVGCGVLGWFLEYYVRATSMDRYRLLTIYTHGDFSAVPLP